MLTLLNLVTWLKLRMRSQKRIANKSRGPSAAPSVFPQPSPLPIDRKSVIPNTHSTGSGLVLGHLLKGRPAPQNTWQKGPALNLWGRSWRPMRAQEVKPLLKERNIVKFIRLGRFRWAGPIAWMDEIIRNKILFGDIFGPSLRGRSMIRWQEGAAMTHQLAAAQNRDTQRRLISSLRYESLSPWWWWNWIKLNVT